MVSLRSPSLPARETEWLKDSRHKRLSSLGEAKEIYPRLMVPGNTESKLVAINFSPSEGEGKELTLIYEDTLELRESDLIGDGPSAEQAVTQDAAEREAGNARADASLSLLQVDGHVGYGCKPGFNVVAGFKYPRPGFVSWIANRTLFTVYYQKNDKNLDNLIEVAESLVVPDV